MSVNQSMSAAGQCLSMHVIISVTSRIESHMIGHTDGHVVNQGLDLQNILRQSYDYLTIMPKLRSTYDGCLIYKTSYEERMAFF